MALRAAKKREIIPGLAASVAAALAAGLAVCGASAVSCFRGVAKPLKAGLGAAARSSLRGSYSLFSGSSTRW